MIAFWIAAALLSAATAGFIVYRGAGSAKAGAGDDPSADVYRRQLAELDELSERGLLAQSEWRSARAETARRLLGAAEADAPATSATDGRQLVLALAAAAPLLAMGVYWIVGSPRLADQPFLKRVADWQASDPASLDPARMSAVLRRLVARHPGDARAVFYLGRAQLAAGDAFSAERSLKKAVALRPREASYWIVLGDILVAEAKGDVSSDAQTAYRRALELDPTAPGPRYYLAEARIAGGDLKGGLADWRALAGGLAADDPRKPALLDEIGVVEKTGALPTDAEAAAPPAGAGQQAFIRSMVDGLAARLKVQPDDPGGWGRLVRSYGVLGDAARRDAALARARRLFKDRPDAWRTFQDAAEARP
jgi:cytochrome c-type biogenesis protein CcmH